jgi:ABC-2 type transport system permease protein
MWKPWKLLELIKQDILDKKWSLVGMGILIGLMGFYVISLISSLDFTQMQAYIESLPEALRAMLGGELDLANPYSLTNAYFYSFIWLYIGIFIIYITSNLIPQEVENHTIDLTLSKPITRTRYLTGKILFVYAFITAILAITTIFIALGMSTATTFLEYGLHWDRLLAAFLLATLHLGTMASTSVFFSTVFLDTKKTTIASVVVMFIMFFIGDFSSLMNPNLGETIQYASTWTYYNTAQVFGTGNFNSLPQNILILLVINIVLAIASLIVFRRKDIPV